MHIKHTKNHRYIFITLIKKITMLTVSKLQEIINIKILSGEDFRLAK